MTSHKTSVLTKAEDRMLREVTDRSRRTETRVTQILTALGVDTRAKRPVFTLGANSLEPARVVLPSPHSSLKEILDSLPESWHGELEVFIGEEYMVTMHYRHLRAGSPQ